MLEEISLHHNLMYDVLIKQRYTVVDTRNCDYDYESTQ